MRYSQMKVELHREGAGVVQGTKFTLDGLDAEAVARLKEEFSREGEVKEDRNSKSVVKFKGIDFMRVVNFLTVELGYTLKSDSNQMGTFKAGSDYRCLRYYTLVKE